MGYTLGVHSVPGEGSTFVVELGAGVGAGGAPVRFSAPSPGEIA